MLSIRESFVTGTPGSGLVLSVGVSGRVSGRVSVSVRVSGRVREFLEVTPGLGLGLG